MTTNHPGATDYCDPYDPHREPAQRTELVFVTPATASRWLAHNHGNRPVSEVTVRRWTDLFNLGRYRLTHQGIAFDQDGNMVDGQHRCSGLSRSDCPGAWVQVTHGVDRAGFAVMDTGNTRRADQFIPGPNASTKAAASRMLTAYPTLSSPTRKVDNETVVSIYHDLQEQIESATDLAISVYRETLINKSMLTALHTVLIAAEFDRARLDEWCRGLETGAGLEAGDPRLALRSRWAIEAKYLNGAGSSTGRLAALYLIVRAWNAYASGESLSRLQLPRGGGASNDMIPEVVR